MTNGEVKSIRQESYKSTRVGLEDNFALQLYHKAKKLFWDPSALNFSEDIKSFKALPTAAQQWVVHLASLFTAGEESVTIHLLPLVQTIAKEGRLEEEMFLTMFLMEEAKHTDFFNRILREVVGKKIGESTEYLHGPYYTKLFYEELPTYMHRLYYDSSPRAQVEAAVTYQMVVEGVVAETGFQLWYNTLGKGKDGLQFPGIITGVKNTNRDEARHIAYGVYLLSRHIVNDPSLLEVAKKRLQYLGGLAAGVLKELLDANAEAVKYFELDVNKVIEVVISAVAKRLQKLEMAAQEGREKIAKLALEQEKEELLSAEFTEDGKYVGKLPYEDVTYKLSE